MEINVIDSVTSKINLKSISKYDFKKLCKCVEYKKVFWKKTPYKMEKTDTIGCAIDKRNGEFLTGLLSRILEQCKKLKIIPKVNYGCSHLKEWPEQNNYPVLKEITFKDYQNDLIWEMTKESRGIIKGATGIGKTIIALGFASQFPKANILFLCHTTQILNQTYKEMEKFGFNPFKIGGGSKVKDNGGVLPRVVISTIQSFSKLHYSLYAEHFDIIIVDEAHHCQNKTSQYFKVLASCLADIKIGLTATLPTQTEKLLTIEGLFGPVIGDLGIVEAQKQKILSDVKIKLLNVPYNAKIGDYRTYKDLYKNGVIFNRKRNGLICDEVKEALANSLITLIMVKEIKHGELIKDRLRKKKIQSHFLKSATNKKLINEVKEGMKQRKVNVVIATDIWREGVDIPSIDCVINACGFKSEIMTLQFVGRGLRKVKGKEYCLIIDFLDPYKHLAEHSIQRLQIYNKNGWLR